MSLTVDCPIRTYLEQRLRLNITCELDFLSSHPDAHETATFHTDELARALENHAQHCDYCTQRLKPN